MTWDDFDDWSPRSLRGAAAQLVASGLLGEPEATARVTGQLSEQLPSGIATPLHRLWTVRSYGTDRSLVGHLWMRVRPSAHEVEAFVLDIEILPEVRGRGWGRAVMLAAEQAALAAGATVLRLNVFAHNDAGVRLYEGLGYDVVGGTLVRSLDEEPPSTTVVLRPPARYDGPGALSWVAHDGTVAVASVTVRIARRSDGRHAFLHELRVHQRERLPAVVAAVERGCRDLEVRSLTVSVPESLPDVLASAQVLIEQCGLRVAAQTMAKALQTPVTS